MCELAVGDPAGPDAYFGGLPWHPSQPSFFPEVQAGVATYDGSGGADEACCPLEWQ